MRFLTLIVMAALSTPALAHKVWLVSKTPAPGVDFTDINAAVAAASDGDLLRILASNDYPSVVINNKSLTLISDSNNTVRIHGLSVRNLAPGKRVVLSDLLIEGGTEAGLAIKNSAGSVWIQDCQIRGAQGFGDFVLPAPHATGFPGLDLLNAGQVSVARCLIEGGAGENYSLSTSPGDGGHAVQVLGTTKLSVHASVLRGGQGGHIDDDNTAWDALDGGHGLAVGAGETLVMSSLLEGGDGGIGGEDFDLFLGFLCGNGGDGGDAIGEVSGGGNGIVRLAASNLVGGAYGPPYAGSGCSGGFAGVPIDVMTAQVLPFEADLYQLSTWSPHVEGQTIFLTVTGPPGSLALIAVGAGPLQSAVPFYAGDLLINPAQLVMFSLGNLPSVTQITAPQVAMVGSFASFYSQIAGYNPANGLLTLGQPLHSVILDTLAQ